MKKKKEPRGIVSGSDLLDDSELISYGGGYSTPEPKYQPGIQELVSYPDPPASDCPFDKLTPEWWSARGYDTPPANYTGDWPARSDLDKRNAILAAREEKARGSKRRDPDNTFLAGEL